MKDSQAPVMSASWNTSRPSCSRLTWPVMAMMGMESIYAVAIPVIKLVAPGPEVAIHTPGRPEARAYPLAMWAAFCSLRTNIWRMGDSYKAS